MLFDRKSLLSKKKNKPTGQETPFEARRRLLAEEAKRLKDAAEKQQRLIEAAPQIAAEKQRRLREAFIRDAARTDKHGVAGTHQLPDYRRLNVSAADARPRLRRKDRNNGKLMFFVLIAALFVSVWWAWQTLFHQSF